ncbi:hypothetical protein [Neptuniibacter sp. QD37_11]|uniref:hypothetical protein n=1 Tax=Neptuniibacter sp. QD37_11 TaxID=3398209 RepID=UPI0039F581D4
MRKMVAVAIALTSMTAQANSISDLFETTVRVSCDIYLPLYDHAVINNDRETIAELESEPTYSRIKGDSIFYSIDEGHAVFRRIDDGTPWYAVYRSGEKSPYFCLKAKPDDANVGEGEPS